MAELKEGWDLPTKHPAIKVWGKGIRFFGDTVWFPLKDAKVEKCTIVYEEDGKEIRTDKWQPTDEEIAEADKNFIDWRKL
jgi:hypothetical protein